jgi:excisionase family DNA binding protein
MPSTREVALDQPEKLLLKADEVARRLSLGRATIYLMMASGELPTFRKGRAVRVPARALEEWIEHMTRVGDSDTRNHHVEAQTGASGSKSGRRNV